MDDPRAPKRARFDSDEEAAAYVAGVGGDDIPRDIWQRILTTDPTLTVRDIQMLCAVSRRIRSLCASGLVWDAIFRRQFGPEALGEVREATENPERRALLRLLSARVWAFAMEQPGPVKIRMVHARTKERHAVTFEFHNYGGFDGPRGLMSVKIHLDDLDLPTEGRVADVIADKLYERYFTRPVYGRGIWGQGDGEYAAGTRVISRNEEETTEAQKMRFIPAIYWLMDAGYRFRSNLDPAILTGDALLVCSFCREGEATQQCGGSKCGAVYCSHACARRDWDQDHSGACGGK